MNGEEYYCTPTSEEKEPNILDLDYKSASNSNAKLEVELIIPPYKITKDQAPRKQNVDTKS